MSRDGSLGAIWLTHNSPSAWSGPEPVKEVEAGSAWKTPYGMSRVLNEMKLGTW